MQKHLLPIIATASLALTGITCTQLRYSELTNEYELAAYVQTVEKEIFHLTNRYRLRNNLPALLPHDRLSNTAREHSYDMVKRRFFSHTCPDGLEIYDRIDSSLPNYHVLSYAENIAAISFIIDPKNLARNFVNSWIKSEGHRRNLLNENATHLGIGVYPGSGNRILYGTQKFMSYSVRMVPRDWEQLGEGKIRTIRFNINPEVVEPANLVVGVNFPDSEARWYTSSGSYYTGFGFLEPHWLSDTEFKVTIPVKDYGLGAYIIRFGISGGTKTYKNGLTLTIRD